MPYITLKGGGWEMHAILSLLAAVVAGVIVAAINAALARIDKTPRAVRKIFVRAAKCKISALTVCYNTGNVVPMRLLERVLALVEHVSVEATYLTNRMIIKRGDDEYALKLLIDVLDALYYRLAE